LRKSKLKLELRIEPVLRREGYVVDGVAVLASNPSKCLVDALSAALQLPGLTASASPPAPKLAGKIAWG